MSGRCAKMRACRGPAAISIAAIASLVFAATATAGSYDVVACSATAGGVSQAFSSSADRGMSAYRSCPNAPSNPESGLVTRASATSGPGSVPYFAGAYQIFEAPAGTALASVSFDHAAIRLASYWTVGIVAFGADFNIGALPYGCYAGNPGCGIGTPSFFGPVTVDLHGQPRFRFETRCVNPSGCDVSASGFRPGTRALFSAANVRVTVSDLTAPAITPTAGALWGAGWHRGFEEGWQSLADNVGIRELRLYVDGSLVGRQDYRDAGWPQHLRCDYTRPRPCNDVLPGGVSLDTRALADGEHSVRVEAIDAAGNASHVNHPFRVDNGAPSHVAASVAGGEGWRRSNRFSLQWGATSGDSAATGSPIVAAHYSICPTAASAGSACEHARRPLQNGSALSDLRLPATGDYVARVWLEDEAGNAMAENASDPVHLRFDGEPPEASFELVDEHDPRRIEALVSDVGSGPGSGTVEIRRKGMRQWHELDTALEGARLVAYVDDLALPDGVYELRAIVRDRAGNEHVGDRRTDGSRMELALPLRERSTLALSTRKWGRCPSRKRVRGRDRRRRSRTTRCLRSTVRDRLRGSGAVHGRLLTGAGEPIAAPVAVLERPRGGGTARLIATVQADVRGGFAYRVTRGPSRVLRFSYAGSEARKPADATLTVLVPARTTITASRRALRNGESVRFRGRLAAGPVPDGGKLIDLQAFYRGGWRTFATPRTDARGSWRYRYRFGATTGLVRYAFRARVRREAAYPYELGYSRVVRVTVRGP